MIRLIEGLGSLSKKLFVKGRVNTSGTRSNFCFGWGSREGALTSAFVGPWLIQLCIDRIWVCRMLAPFEDGCIVLKLKCLVIAFAVPAFDFLATSLASGKQSLILPTDAFAMPRQGATDGNCPCGRCHVQLVDHLSVQVACEPVSDNYFSVLALLPRLTVTRASR